MTFPDLADPESVLDGMALLDAEYPGLFRWMGEVSALSDDTEWGWQAKYFTTLGDSRFAQSSPDTPAAEATAGGSPGSEGTETCRGSRSRSWLKTVL